MLTRVEVTTRQGTLLKLPLEDVSNGYIVEEIQGLDPVKATLVSSSFAQIDGEQYHSSRREARNIKIKLGLEPDFVNTSVSSLRNRLYGFLMPKTEVTLRFVHDDGLEVDILARVETFETPLFTKEPEVDVSLMCFSPDFYDPTPVNISGMTTDLTTETLVHYAGSVEAGITFDLSVDRSLNEFTIYHRPPDGSLRSLAFVSPLVAGDALHISTISGTKGAALTREGVVTSMLWGVAPQSDWIEFQPGDNHIRVYATGVGIPFNIQYTTKYGGL